MANKTIPISLARSAKTRRRNYTAPKKPGDPEGGGLQVEAKFPTAPKLGNGRNVLGREGMREWRRITRLLSNAKVVAEVDRTVLTQYCKLWEMFCADSCPAGTSADMFGGGKGDERKEFTAAMHTQMRLCAVELGLTPSARSRLRG